MGLLDFMAAGSGQTAPAGLLSPAQPVSGLLSPGAGGAEAQKWANALAALAAARQRQTQNAADPASYVNLLAGLARLAGAARPVNVPAVPLPSAAPPAAALLQNAPARMSQSAAPQESNPISSAQTMPAQNSGWAVQKVR